MLLTLALLLLQDPAAGSGDPIKDVKDKDPLVRIAAVAGLEARGEADAKAFKALLSALKDDDWEVAETAANALGRMKSVAAAKELAELAAEAPIRRLRAAAARALAASNDPKAVDALAAAASSKKTGPGALQALAEYATTAAAPLPASEVRRELKDKDPAIRAAAAAALHAAPKEEQREMLLATFEDEDLRVPCAALEALARRGDPTLLPAVAEAMSRTGLNDVVSRRLVRAATSCATEVSETARVVDQAAGQIGSAPAEVGMRFLAWAGAIGPPGWKLVQAGLASGNVELRAAAAHATRGWAAHAESKTALLALAAADASGRVRRAAMAALVQARGAADPEVTALLIDRLAKDTDAAVREKAAVALGAPALKGAAEALVEASRAADWKLAVCAAISMGRARGPVAIARLIELSDHADWKLRGAAAVGMLYTFDKEPVPALIKLLDDPEPRVSRTAHEILIRLTYQKFDRKSSVYASWWEKNKNLIQVLTPEEAEKRGKDYAFSESRARSFADLDVMVFQSRGDAIETLLTRIGIPHRRTSAGQVAGAELHPFAVYMSNCTGEIEASDVEALQWHVYTGGYFFGSCWSLGHTIQQIYPGVLRMYPGHEEGTIMDRVEARACDPTSPYLQGVFPHETEPIYDLQGAHLIEVMQPERCEVLVDSPGCAARWGCGNLAAWFEVGHGLILDSANHFQEQGIANAPNLKKPEERMVYAFDHMALEYSAWREQRDAKWWKNTRDTAQQVFDESAFRFITNFVRQKRVRDL
jgi:HEAT repeat protein